MLKNSIIVFCDCCLVGTRLDLNGIEKLRLESKKFFRGLNSWNDAKTDIKWQLWQEREYKRTMEECIPEWGFEIVSHQFEGEVGMRVTFF